MPRFHPPESNHQTLIQRESAFLPVNIKLAETDDILWNSVRSVNYPEHVDEASYRCETIDALDANILSHEIDEKPADRHKHRHVNSLAVNIERHEGGTKARSDFRKQEDEERDAEQVL
jgi:hypothetical protein